VKRSILLALVAALALALAVGANVTASADTGAQATAKKKAAKKKAKCPAKPKKKTGKSLAADSAAKKKGKKKAACKPKKKAKGKAKPKAPTGPPAAFSMTDGVYDDVTSTTLLTVTGGGTKAELTAPLSCFIYRSESVPLTTSGNTAKASETRDTPIAGEPSHSEWSLTVQSSLDFTLPISWDVGGGLCKSSTTINGKFVKK